MRTFQTSNDRLDTVAEFTQRLVSGETVAVCSVHRDHVHTASRVMIATAKRQGYTLRRMGAWDCVDGEWRCYLLCRACPPSAPYRGYDHAVLCEAGGALADEVCDIESVLDDERITEEIRDDEELRGAITSGDCVTAEQLLRFEQACKSREAEEHARNPFADKTLDYAEREEWYL